MTTFFIWLESGALSQWVRGENGSLLVFPVVICLHALGMGFMAGSASMLSLRVLGHVPHVPLARLAAFLPFAWFALAVNVASGLLLLIGYPTKALTNPVFYLKLGCIAAALWCLCRLRERVLLVPQPELAIDGTARRLAAAGIALWIAAIVTGRLLAYTYTRFLSI